MRKTLVLVTILAALTIGASAGEQKITIISPTDGSSVSHRPIIEGMVRNPSPDVWVVVHPLEVSDYWVQPRVTVRENGSWKVQIYVGRPGTVDNGKRFEIRAVTDPELKLREGQVLDGWPKSAAISNVVEVTRK